MTDVTTVLAGAAAVVAVAAGARGTWSPCGISMLSSITPLAERGRGHRFWSTATWFVAGAVVGGLCLGAATAVLASGVGAAGPSTTTVVVVGVSTALLAAASDAQLGRFHLPIHRRQVNERWLDQFRPWVYGGGFGWQIGVGLATYIKTAAVYLMVVLLALAGETWVALAGGALFGLVRGMAVFLGRHITSFEELARFHRRMTELDGLSVAVVVTVEVLVAMVCGWLLSPWVATATGAVALAMTLRRTRTRWPTRAGAART